MLVAKLVILGILSSILLILALYASFSTTSFFTTSLSLPKSTGTDTIIYQDLIYLLYFSNHLNYLVHFLTYQNLIYLHKIFF